MDLTSSHDKYTYTRGYPLWLLLYIVLFKKPLITWIVSRTMYRRIYISRTINLLPQLWKYDVCIYFEITYWIKTRRLFAFTNFFDANQRFAFLNNATLLHATLLLSIDSPLYESLKYIHSSQCALWTSMMKISTARCIGFFNAGRGQGNAFVRLWCVRSLHSTV